MIRTRFRFEAFSLLDFHRWCQSRRVVCLRLLMSFYMWAWTDQRSPSMQCKTFLFFYNQLLVTFLPRFLKVKTIKMARYILICGVFCQRKYTLLNVIESICSVWPFRHAGSKRGCFSVQKSVRQCTDNMGIIWLCNMVNHPMFT